MNNSEQIKKRVVRFVGGLAFAIVFIIFAIISVSVAPHSSDIGDDYDMYVTHHRGVEREKKVIVDDSTAFDTAAVGTGTASAPAEEAPAENPEVAAEPVAEGPSLPNIDVNSWEYMLVNTASILDASYEPPEIVYLNMTADDRNKPTAYDGNRLPVDSRIADALLDMAEGCKAAGLPVFLSSSYRSYSEQDALLQRKIGQGYDYDTAITIVAAPGTSEHQTGLCCDITDRYRELKDSSLEETDTYKWLAAHCTDYGFIVRYPANKSGGADSVTGVIYEPWHFRYVGVEVAKYITENDLSLEEFVALYA